VAFLRNNRALRKVGGGADAARHAMKKPVWFEIEVPRFARALALGAGLLCAATQGAVAAQPRSAPPAAAVQQGGVAVLIYHEVATDNRAEGDTAISLAHFSEQMELLADEGFVTVGVADLVRYMKGEIALPPKAVVLTFEDGWKSVLDATPVLERHRFKASFTIITGNGIGGDYLGWSDIEKLAANPRYEIVSHTVSHPWDASNNLVTWVQGANKEEGRRDALNELSESKRVLEQRLGRPTPFLAWPSGWFDDTLIGLAKQAGYTALLTTEDGLNQRGDDVLRIRRTFVDGTCDLSTFRRTVTTGRYFSCQKQARNTQ
jgi:peptidoglycan/xylan/chitin deacetylase (PgdA/CDA1 family)